MAEESSEVPGELIGKSRAVVDFLSVSAAPSPPPPIRPLSSRTSPRPWGRRGVGQGRWGGAGKFALVWPLEKLSPKRAGLGRNREPRERSPRLCWRLPAPPPAVTGGPGWRKKGAGCLGLGDPASEENPLQRPVPRSQLGKSRKAQDTNGWRAHSRSPPARARSSTSHPLVPRKLSARGALVT